jgi:uncharacterized protein
MTSAETAYIDTSAAVKLVASEAETPALLRSLRTWRRRASSIVLRVELLRAIRRSQAPQLVTDARRHLESIELIRVDDDVLERAATLDPPTLRSLDAIHLATAISLGADLAALITYDERMRAAALELGLPVVSPR